MNILVIDDEKLAMEGLCAQLRAIAPGAFIHGFLDGAAALDFRPEAPHDVAFLDIQLRDMDGMTLAAELKRRNPLINLIFTTGYQEYAQSAFALYASGYVMKPVTPDKLSRELSHLRHPVAMPEVRRVRARAFGNFEFFIDGEPARFHYTKTHELIAYLVDRNGALCANGELISILWEDRDSSQRISYLKNLRADLLQTLREHGCEDILLRQRGKLGIAPDKIECDYYNWLAGNNRGLNAYRGEYMKQYSWSEFTQGKI